MDIIEKESDRLSNMVEELLDFSRFVSGRITLEKEEIQLCSSIKQVAKQFSPRAKERNMLFIVSCPEDLPIIIADENRIKQVLINLLDNAFKFTPDGGQVELKIGMEGGESLLIQVRDNGYGIPEEDIPYIMEKFYKGGKNSKSHSGLGLSICDEIVKLHGGHININSSLGEGTCISVYLPVEGRS